MIMKMLLREYYKKTKPHLESEEVGFFNRRSTLLDDEDEE